MTSKRAESSLILLYASFLSGYTCQTFNFALVCMTTNGTNTTVWSTPQQGVLMSMYGAGCVVFMVPMALAIFYHNLRTVISYILALLLGCTLLIHLSTFAGSYASFVIICILRFITGSAENLSSVARYPFAATWLPKNEIVTFLSLSWLFYELGLVLADFSSGFICESSVGWPAIFYLNSLLLLIGVVVVWLCYYDDPNTCASISAEERRLIISERALNLVKLNDIPWFSILKSLPFWAVTSNMFVSIWQSATLNVLGPQYWQTCMNLSQSMNGIVSATGVTVFMIGRLIAASLSKIENCSCKSETMTIRVWNFVTWAVSSLGVLGMAFVPCGSTPLVPIFLYCLAKFGGAFGAMGYEKSSVLIAPNFCAIVSGLGGLISYSPYFITPLVAQNVFLRENPQNWQPVFLMLVGLATAFGCGFFTIFGSGEPESWNGKYEEIEAES